MNMLIIEKYSKEISTDGFMIIKAKEICNCPLCGGNLRVRDSKKRCVINQAGDIDMYRLRRLKCKNCGKLHTEIPDCIVPYKHYAAEVVESELLELRNDCPADDSTSWRWKFFFASLAVIANKYNLLIPHSHWLSYVYFLVEKVKKITHPLCIPFPNLQCYNSI